MDLIDECTSAFINKYRSSQTDVRELALQSHQYSEINLKEALQQISGWQTALHKIPSWAGTDGIVYPPSLSMEQCSSEHTARYKAGILHSFSSEQPMDSFVDLTGGLGVDFSFLAPLFGRAVYVEQQSSLCERARHNFRLLNLDRVEVRQVDAVDYLYSMPPVDWIYLDPARRDEKGRKTVRISDCKPDVSEIQGLLKSRAYRILLKLSPMLDIIQVLRDLPGMVEEIHVVAVAGECKELLFVLHSNLPDSCRLPIHAVNITSSGNVRKFSFYKEEEQQAVCEFAAQPLSYLYEPHAAVLKAGAYRLIAQKFGIRKMHPDAHLYTSEDYHEDFPGRGFRILGYAGFNKKELKQLLRELTHAHLTLRGFPSTVVDLRKRLSLKEGGDTYLFATMNKEGQKLLIRCCKVGS